MEIGAAMVGAAIGAMPADPTLMAAQKLMNPGTSAVFVLDSEGDMEAILHAIRDLGGTVLRTNVDAERAPLIQATLAATPGAPPER